MSFKREKLVRALEDHSAGMPLYRAAKKHKVAETTLRRYKKNPSLLCFPSPVGRPKAFTDFEEGTFTEIAKAYELIGLPLTKHLFLKMVRQEAEQKSKCSSYILFQLL